MDDLLELFLQETKEMITKLYDECVSREEYGEEAFYELIENTFIDIFEEFCQNFDCSERIANWVAFTVIPEDERINKEKLAAAIYEAYYTYRFRAEILNNPALQEKMKTAVDNWKKTIYKLGD